MRRAQQRIVRLAATPRVSNSVRAFRAQAGTVNSVEEEEIAKDRAALWRYSVMAGFGVLCGATLWYGSRQAKKRYFGEEGSARVSVETRGRPSLGGPFVLVTTDGVPVSQADFLGSWTFFYFGFTHCPEICPVELNRMSKVVDAVRAARPKEKILPLFISCDPRRDSLEAIREYLSAFHPDFVGLVGTPKQVSDACRSYRIYYSLPSDDAAESNDYLIDHSIAIFLFDPKGRFVEFFGNRYDEKEITDRVLHYMTQLESDPDWTNCGCRMGPEELPLCKLVLLGDERVGKTCLLHSYANGLDYLARREDYNRTLMENYEFILPVSGIDSGPRGLRLSSWDTAGQEEYDELRRMCYTTINTSVCEVSAFILCFAWDDPQSLTNVQMRWYREVRRVEREAKAAACHNGLDQQRRPFALILCGTKYDLRVDADQSGQSVGVVTREEAYGVLQSIQADALVVCSSKTGFGVRDAFHTAIQMWLQDHPAFTTRPPLLTSGDSTTQDEESARDTECYSARSGDYHAKPCSVL